MCFSSPSFLPLCLHLLFPLCINLKSLVFLMAAPSSLPPPPLPHLCCSAHFLRHAACSPGGVGSRREESGRPGSSPAVSGQLLLVQPETQTGSATAPGRTLHRQVNFRHSAHRTEGQTFSRRFSSGRKTSRFSLVQVLTTQGNWTHCRFFQIEASETLEQQ